MTVKSRREVMCINKRDRFSPYKRITHIVSASAHGNAYVKTKPDGEETNNLLSLPECK
jgi:hypothetical protein